MFDTHFITCPQHKRCYDGSCTCTGDPARLIHHLGLGVWSFLASPASGLVEGARRGAPERIAAGMLDGTRGLITNTVYAFSNATAKMSGAARKVRSVRVAHLTSIPGHMRAQE